MPGCNLFAKYPVSTYETYIYVAHIYLSYARASIIYRISRVNSRVSLIYGGPLSRVIRAVGSDFRHRCALIPFLIQMLQDFSNSYVKIYISSILHVYPRQGDIIAKVR